MDSISLLANGLAHYAPKEQTKETSLLHFVIKNKANFQKELIKKLLNFFADKKAEKLAKKLSRPIVNLSCKREGSQSGTVKLKIKRSSLMICHYLIRFKGKAQKYIEIYLFDLRANLNLSSIMKDIFEDNQRAYRHLLNANIDDKAMKYLRYIGKGNSDFEIEKKLHLSRVELLDLKQNLSSILQLRNTNELYWVSQRAGYVNRK